jgi:hypothetical protein
MARETKAERQAREAAEREQYLAEQAASYPQRLMEVMQRAQAVDFDLEVKSDCMFHVYDRERYTTYELDYFYSVDSDEVWATLRFRVEMLEEENAEEERKYLAKKAALAKLTKEEKALLNL